jgi:hypothetical protein
MVKDFYDLEDKVQYIDDKIIHIERIMENFILSVK